jgi:hypothetical protein
VSTIAGVRLVDIGDVQRVRTAVLGIDDRSHASDLPLRPNQMVDRDRDKRSTRVVEDDARAALVARTLAYRPKVSADPMR